jgi:adenosylcobinamide-GDP ribazoletransferase
MFDASTRSALIARAWRDLLDAWRFFSRLPAPSGGAASDAAAGAGLDLARFSWACPIAGALIGAVGAVAFGLAALLGLPPLLRAAFAVATVILAAGAMHEDGLAGFADGFGGGQTRESKLAITRDGRVGVYGTLALILSLVVRVAALAALARGGFFVAAASLILSGAVSRAGALIPLAPPPPAGADGADAGAGRLEAKDLIAAGFAVVGVALVVGLVALGVMQALFACVLAAAAAWGTSALARRQIGGPTSDVAGAAQQAAEIVCLVGLLIGGRAP